MDLPLKRVLQGDTDNYMLPFLWMMGEEWEKTKRQLDKIYECGIRAVCLESRTFEDFCGETWWETLKKALEYAREKEMKIWILDDKHFPTGFACGLADEKYPERRRLNLMESHLDVMGPRNVDWLLRRFDPEDELLGVFAMRRTAADENILSEEIIPLQADEKGDYVSFDAPDGCWRIFALWMTRAGAYPNRSYINMLTEEGTDVLIEAVYEAHYQHVGEYFGKELAGFFSDEPSIGNNYVVYGTGNGDFYDRQVGQRGLALPWRKDLLTRLSQRMGRDVFFLLPQLWYEGKESVEIREAYMEEVSALYGRCFTRRVGDWCRAHGVEYIGHIIEDANAHARLGCSAGHFFRALEGQDMAGMDIVLHQVMPGMAHFNHPFISSGGTSNAAFNHYALGKLAGSLAHIRPHMKNRAMCEVFGAYGWAEDMPTMKWLMDYLFVRGINYFVPHAFSPLYPNPDCPPHFDGDGENPQFDDFAHLMRYSNQMSTLLQGNRVAKIAVLYHAEAEWSQKPCMYNEQVAQVLMDRQLDFDIVPADDLVSPVIENGKWMVGNGVYDALVIPQADYWPEHIAKGARMLMDGGVYVGKIGENTPIPGAQTLSLETLADEMLEKGFGDVVTDGKAPYLRAMHIQREGSHVFMFVNEGIHAAAETKVQLPVSGHYAFVDLLGGCSKRMYTEDGAIALALCPYESAVLVFDGEMGEAETADDWESEALDAIFTIEAADAGNMDAFRLVEEKSSLKTIEKWNRNFAGRIRYTAMIQTEKKVDALLLEQVGDTALVYVNGREAGRRICPPYRFDVGNLWQDGENRVEILVSTTLGRKIRDGFSTYVPMNRPGAAGKLMAQRKK